MVHVLNVASYQILTICETWGSRAPYFRLHSVLLLSHFRLPCPANRLAAIASHSHAAAHAPRLPLLCGRALARPMWCKVKQQEQGNCSCGWSITHACLTKRNIPVEIPVCDKCRTWGFECVVCICCSFSPRISTSDQLFVSEEEEELLNCTKWKQTYLYTDRCYDITVKQLVNLKDRDSQLACWRQWTEEKPQLEKMRSQCVVSQVTAAAAAA